MRGLMIFRPIRPAALTSALLSCNLAIFISVICPTHHLI
ncbi:hypothetical protein FOXYSP1_04427 [Fusarium oxysporum f. sp. phaseoli]